MDKGYSIIRLVTDNIRKTNIPIGIFAFNEHSQHRGIVLRMAGISGMSCPAGIDKKTKSTIGQVGRNINEYIRNNQRLTRLDICKKLPGLLPANMIMTGPFLCHGWDTRKRDAYEMSSDLYSTVVLGA